MHINIVLEHQHGKYFSALYNSCHQNPNILTKQGNQNAILPLVRGQLQSQGLSGSNATDFKVDCFSLWTTVSDRPYFRYYRYDFFAWQVCMLHSWTEKHQEKNRQTLCLFHRSLGSDNPSPKCDELVRRIWCYERLPKLIFKGKRIFLILLKFETNYKNPRWRLL